MFDIKNCIYVQSPVGDPLNPIKKRIYCIILAYRHDKIERVLCWNRFVPNEFSSKTVAEELIDRIKQQIKENRIEIDKPLSTDSDEKESFDLTGYTLKEPERVPDAYMNILIPLFKENN